MTIGKNDGNGGDPFSRHGCKRLSASIACPVLETGDLSLTLELQNFPISRCHHQVQGNAVSWSIDSQLQRDRQRSAVWCHAFAAPDIIQAELRQFGFE